MRTEEADRAVTPVIADRLARRVQRDIRVVELEHRHQFHSRHAQRLEVRNLLDHARERSGMRHARTRGPCEAADVRFINDRFMNRPIQRLVALPVIHGRIHDRAAHRG